MSHKLIIDAHRVAVWKSQQLHDLEFHRKRWLHSSPVSAQSLVSVDGKCRSSKWRDLILRYANCRSHEFMTCFLIQWSFLSGRMWHFKSARTVTAATTSSTMGTFRTCQELGSAQFQSMRYPLEEYWHITNVQLHPKASTLSWPYPLILETSPLLILQSRGQLASCEIP